MLGKLAREGAKLVRKAALKKAVAPKRGAKRNTALVRGGAGGGSGMYLFVAHPNCCPKCNELGRAKRFFNTPDVAYITHPNCLCMTIEAPAGLTPTELRAWADNPIGGRVAYGFNYGVPLVSKTITEKNHEKTMADWSKRMANGGAWAKGTRQGRMKVRASVTPQKIGAVRRKINKEGFKMAEEIKLKRTRARKAVTERNLDLKPQKGQTFNDFLSSATSSKTAKQKFALEKKRIGKAEVFMPKTTLSKKKVGKANVFMPSGKTNLLK